MKLPYMLTAGYRCGDGFYRDVIIGRFNTVKEASTAGNALLCSSNGGCDDWSVISLKGGGTRTVAES